MEYNPQQIEPKWRQYWSENKVNAVATDADKPKFYVLDMFPYPSGAGLHVGHPLGYIATDIIARYKKLNGFNVLHPMGYDAFGLPAEQYAIQTGVHPAVSTDKNINMYRSQLDNLGFNYDWSRSVKTCDPKYYKWTQWIFTLLFKHYYDLTADKALPITDLVATFEREGNAAVNAFTAHEGTFTADEWKAMSRKAQDDILMNYRLAYRKVGFVNWCEALGTVLANDEVKDGVSERGGHPVTKKAMMQWSLRITAYAERLLKGLDALDWSDALKAAQRNWIGRSEGAAVFFEVEGTDTPIEIFTTRPDTIFGATFMVLAPEHDLVSQITTPEQQAEIDQYLEYVQSRSDLERMADTKTVSGAFTGGYAKHPFTGERIPIYIAEYVLKDYGTGAIMAVPSDDERDHRFATHFGLPIVEVVDKSAYPDAGIGDKVGTIVNSDFLNGLSVKEAIQAMFDKIEALSIGQKKINYKLRDANFSRQRYWGEPFPVAYDADDVPVLDESLPVELPGLDNFEPTASGKSPLSRVTEWVNTPDGLLRETDTMPGYAGSSWYFLRYMDANNDHAFASPEALNYWQNVDLYVGGSEHAVGHLMYSRMWQKVLFDLGYVPTDEPFQKVINQGMIQGRSNFVYRANEAMAEVMLRRRLKEYEFDFQTEYPIAGRFVDFAMPQHKLAIEVKSGSDLKRYLEQARPAIEAEGWRILALPMQDLAKYIHNFDHIIKRINKAIEGEIDYDHLDDEHDRPVFFSLDVVEKHNLDAYVTTLHVDVNIVHNDYLDMEAFTQWRSEYANAVFVTNEEGKYRCGHAVEKMSKSKYNVVNPDLMVEKYGADCFRMYEMFLGPIEQSKPWDTNGIEGVSKFLRKLWSLFYSLDGWQVTDEAPTKAEYKALHTLIKKLHDDIERFSFNTCISGMMVSVNELKKLNCHKRAILEPLTVLVAPFAPHLADELWQALGNTGSIHEQGHYPAFEERYMVEDSIEYPVSINGKKRASAEFAADASREEMEKAVLAMPQIQKWIEDKSVQKVIVVPKRMINIVIK